MSSPIDLADVERLVSELRALLAGHSPELQGAAIADLLSVFLAGHHPELREHIFHLTTEMALAMVPENERILFSTRERPKEWPPTPPYQPPQD